MASPTWVRIGTAVAAGASFAALYLGAAYPRVGFALIGVVGIWNAFVAGYGYAPNGGAPPPAA